MNDKIGSAYLVTEFAALPRLDRHGELLDADQLEEG